MGIWFNDLLRNNGVDPSQVRLLRHQDSRAALSPYRAWRDERHLFEQYQTTMSSSPSRRSQLASPIWAAFVVDPRGDTLFAGLYNAERGPPNDSPLIDSLSGQRLEPGSVDIYTVSPLNLLQDFEGRVVIDWGKGFIAWNQAAARNNKLIIELRRTFSEPEFPGYGALVCSLSEVASFPPTWTTALQAARGIYLLTCARTREQYVGSASGEGGFLARWLQYARDGHGGNVRLKSRDPSDYQVCILEIASFATGTDEIVGMETRWKQKLLSREMGLNAN